MSVFLDQLYLKNITHVSKIEEHFIDMEIKNDLLYNRVNRKMSVRHVEHIPPVNDSMFNIEKYIND